MLAVVIELALRRHRLSLEAGVLDIVTTFHHERFTLSDLVLDQGRVLDLSEHTRLKPLWKSKGTALPGFQSGWFRLRNRQKAFVAITDGRRVLWLPTRLGFDLLLQPRQPRVLLERLNEMALASPGR